MCQFIISSSLSPIPPGEIESKRAIKASRRLPYSYLVLLHRTDLSPTAEEYPSYLNGNRMEPGGLNQGYSLTSGFAFIFCPSIHQSAPLPFRYLGDEAMGAGDAYVVAFAQRPSEARSTSFVSVEGETVPTFVQGIEWVDKNSFPIIRVRTDLLAPLPLPPSPLHPAPRSRRVLDQQTTEVRFAEVHFLGVVSPLWLPSEVNLCAKFIGDLFRNQHHDMSYERRRVSSKIRTP